MNKPSFRIAAAFGAAAIGLAIGVGAAFAAGPHAPGGAGFGAAAAAGGTGPGTTSVIATTGYGTGSPGWAGAGNGTGPGTYAQAREQALTAALAQSSGSLTADQAQQLASMAEEEKLALDLCTALGQQYSTPVWRNVAASEATHLATVRTLLSRYGIADPTAGMAAGDFASLEAKSLYRSLLSQGSTSEAAAWTVGATVEKDDLARLAAAGTGVTAPDVLAVYASLDSASDQHLASFERLAGV